MPLPRLDLVCPKAGPRSRGNLVSAERMADLLSHTFDVAVTAELARHASDWCIAMHAVRSAESIRRHVREHATGRLVVFLTGTDIYGPKGHEKTLHASLRAAWRILANQPLARARIPAALRWKFRFVPKSTSLPERVIALAARHPPEHSNTVVALAHLRDEKDPLLLADAMDRLPARVRLDAVHFGAARDSAWRRVASARNSSRWRWAGELPRSNAMRELARARAIVLTSRVEGAPNVLLEAAALGRPILATRIPGVVGILGGDHPGLFPAGDVDALCRSLRRLAENRAYVRELGAASRALARRSSPNSERMALLAALDEPIAGPHPSCIAAALRQR
jgi:glycosyltransferase involved in cell wall biosynthesis